PPRAADPTGCVVWRPLLIQRSPRHDTRRIAMPDSREFYIDGQWVKPRKPHAFPVQNPATEEPIATISLGSAADVDDAVAAARRAFPAYSQTTREERLDLLMRIMGAYQQHYDEMAETISREMGAPFQLSKAAQAAAPMAHLATILEALEGYEFDQEHGSTLMRREPIGVCGFLTPWNWPANPIALQ